MDKYIKLMQGLEMQTVDEDMKNEAEAALALNKDCLTFASFILTDDLPNANKQRIPREEFANLVKSGIFMPIKMAEGKISEGHANTKPIGVITHLKAIGNQIKGIAALWNKERPEDIELVKKAFSEKRPLNLSWEILYSESNKNDDDVEELKNTSLSAVTLVGLPAYEGRTQILAVASKWSSDYINSLPDSSFLYVESSEEGKKRYFPYQDSDGVVDISQVKNALAQITELGLSAELSDEIKSKAEKIVAEAESKSNLEENSNVEKLEEALAKIDELKAQLEAKDAELASRDSTIASLTTEKDELSKFKTDVEAERASASKLDSIKNKFKEAGIEKEDSYFVDNKDRFLALDEEAIDFLVQEMVSFASKKNGEASAHPGVPVITGDNGEAIDIKELAKALKESKVKK